jgi:glutamate synthase (ferredoxin)
VFVEGKPGQTGDALERELFIARKLVERAKVAALPADVASDFYFCTLSNRTIVYKVGWAAAAAGPGQGVNTVQGSMCCVLRC